MSQGEYYVTSDNPNRRWDLTNTMLDLGYRPQDSWTEGLLTRSPPLSPTLCSS